MFSVILTPSLGIRLGIPCVNSMRMGMSTGGTGMGLVVAESRRV